MNDYPNESDAIREDGPWSVEKPEERKEAEQKEQEKVNSSIAVIQDVLDWLDKCAESYASIDSLNVDEQTDPNAALVAMNTAKKMRAAFQSQAAAFRSQFSKHLQKLEENPKA
jgi:hypothetical protein